MFKISGYVELNIPIGPNCKSMCETAIRLGYKVLCINTPVVSRNVNNGGGSGKKVGKKRKWEERSSGIIASTAFKNNSGIPLPLAEPWMEELIQNNSEIRIMSRLTVIFSELNELITTLNQERAKQYDILAVIPTNHDALQSCLNSPSVVIDIIGFDFEGPHWLSKLRLNYHKGVLAGERDIFFELTYSSALHGNEATENLIYTANSLTQNVCTKRLKNLVISSGGANHLEIKSPRDVVSLSFLLGLDETTGRFCIREHAHRIIQKSDGRKIGKSWVAFIPTDSASASLISSS